MYKSMSILVLINIHFMDMEIIVNFFFNIHVGGYEKGVVVIKWR
jgi:hypothetical protein